MKIIIFHNVDGEDEKKAAGLVQAVTADNGAVVEALTCGFSPEWETAELSADLSFFSGATHLVVLGKGDKTPRWFPFPAGFAYGTGCPLVWCGAAVSRPGYAPDIIAFDDESGLLRYLREEAAKSNGRAIVQKARNTLLERGIPLTIAAFANCVREGDTAAARLFLDAGFSSNEKDANGVSLLGIAARAGQRDMARLLIAANGNVNTPSLDRGNTPLIDAALGKHTGIVRDLIDAGADVNAKSKDGQSALIIAVGLSDAATTELLFQADANADAPDVLGASARKYAMLFRQPAILALFERYAPAEA
jgi:hypothetical protein